MTFDFLSKYSTLRNGLESLLHFIPDFFFYSNQNENISNEWKNVMIASNFYMNPFFSRLLLLLLLYYECIKYSTFSIFDQLNVHIEDLRPFEFSLARINFKRTVCQAKYELQKKSRHICFRNAIQACITGNPLVTSHGEIQQNCSCKF